MNEQATSESVVDRVRRLLEAGDASGLREYLEEFHPSDLADLIESLEQDQRGAVLRVLPDELASETLAEMEEIAHPEALLVADPDRVRELLRELSDDDAADIVGELPPEKQREVLAQLPLAEAGELRELLAYDEESAGGIMTAEVLSVFESATVAEAIDEIRQQAEDINEFWTVFVVDKLRRLRGTVSLQNLILSPPSRPIGEITEPAIAVVPARMDQEEVARVMSRYNLVSIPVVDPLGRLVGRVTFDDVMDIIEAESTEDILRLAGIPLEEEVRGGMGEAIRSRLPWLLLNLLTVSIAAAVVYLFQGTIERAVLLAVAMPVIAGLGGNAGTQALAVTVRRLALSPESSGDWDVVLKEIGVGLVNGVVVGLVVAVMSYLVATHWAGDFAYRPEMLGLVVMLAMWFNLVIAGFAGAFVPVMLERLGVDPAVASSIFVTTLTDLFGFFFLLGLATAILLPQL